MAAYTKTTNFTAKDSLLSGNPSKVVKGTELDAEFTAISASISTKADLNSPTLVTPALGTPSAGVLTNCTGYPVSGLGSLGTGVATALAINVGSAGAFTTFNGALGTPASGTLTNATGLPISTGVSGLGTSVATALSVSVGSAGAFTTFNGALGTPASGTLTNATGLPVSTGISGFGTGVATFLATPSSANLLAAVTDETGTGSAVFATSPTLVTPVLGTPSSGNLSNCTAYPVASIANLGTGVATFLTTPSSANLLAAVTDETGTGALVFATSPTLTTPVLGTPTSGTLTNCTKDGTNGIGYLNIPQNSQSAAYTTVLADAGKHILHPAADTTARIFTIDSNDNVAYPIGTAITFVNENAAGVITIAITSDTMYLAGLGTTGSRTLAANGVATALKISSTVWIISGTALT